MKTETKAKKTAPKKTKKIVEEKSGKMAVILTGGKQYIVKQGDTLKVEKLNVGENEKVNFDKVLLIVDGENVQVGKPFIEKASVSATVKAQGRNEKINVIHYKAKTRHRKKYGHRQPFTEVKIENI